MLQTNRAIDIERSYRTVPAWSEQRGAGETETGGIDPVSSSRSTTRIDLRLMHSLLRTILYYDVFNFPLRKEEIELYSDSMEAGTIRIPHMLEELRRRKLIAERKGFWYASHREKEIVDRRIAMEKMGIEMWEKAGEFGTLIRRMPFVRGIFISGQLCRYIADEESDIDYFIVTEPGHLWIARTMLVLFRRVILLNNRKYLCANYFVTTDNLAIRERNLYAACETASLKPLWNRQLFDRFVRENRWIEEYYPMFDIRDVDLKEGIAERRSRIQRGIEWMIPKKVATLLDRKLMNLTRRYWQWKFPEMSHDEQERMLRCSPEESRAHPSDLTTIIMEAYHRNLQAYGVEEETSRTPCEGTGVSAR